MTHRSRPNPRLRRELIGLAAAIAVGAVVLAVLGACRAVAHRGEAVIVAMVPALAAWLWIGWPRVRRWRWNGYVVYLVVMTVVVGGAETLVARLARGRVLPIEVFWALYFIVAWRLAWAIWARTVGRLLEPRRRLARRRSASRRAAKLDIGIRVGVPILRGSLTMLIFAPLFFGSLVHRSKIGNPRDLGPYAGLGIEPVTFPTADGLTLSGWFWPEPRSDAAVVICHGLGANKGNFIDFLSVFHGSRYSALIFDFRGHGDSDGHTSTFGLDEVADVRAAVDWLKRHRPRESRHVYGLGSSMGAMSLVRAAADDPRIEAVVLDSCFVSARTVAHDHLGRIPFVGDALAELALSALSLHAGCDLDALDARPALATFAPRPVFLIHGKDDVLFPPRHLDLLFAAAHDPKHRWLGPGPHSNILSTEPIEYQRRVIDFLDAVARANLVTDGARRNPRPLADGAWVSNPILDRGG